MTKRIAWILVAIVIYDLMALLNSSYRVLNWPDAATVYVSADHTTRYQHADGSEEYKVEVPLKEFPYDVQLQQHCRFDLVWVSSTNLVLLALLIRSLRRMPQSQRNSQPNEDGSSAVNVDANTGLIDT